jgi:thiosulfate reductase cytochrome b subunit
MRIYRHNLVTRITHAVNAACLLALLMSGLNIFMALPGLYIGQTVDYAHPAAEIVALHYPSGRVQGVTRIGGLELDTTGFLGVNKGLNGTTVTRAFPRWMTLPAARDLAKGRRWHFFFAWGLVINGALYLAWNTARRHIQKDLWPSRADLAAIPRSILDHLLLRHATGEAAIPYNVLQKLAYLAVILVLVPGMVLTGLTMSPGMDAALPVLPWMFGGRQTARTLHFLIAGSLVAFFVVHMVQMVLAGPINEITSIITGWYRVPQAHSPEGDKP